MNKMGRFTADTWCRITLLVAISFLTGCGGGNDEPAPNGGGAPIADQAPAAPADDGGRRGGGRGKGGAAAKGVARRMGAS